MSEGVAPLLWQLRLRLTNLWAQEPTFRRALSAVYARHCRNLPDVMARPVKAPLLGHDVPTFANASASDVEALTWDPDDGEAATWAAAYLAAIERMGARYGLRRWGWPGGSADGVSALSYGEMLIHRWCAMRAGSGFGPERFAWAVGAEAYFVPERTRALEVRWDPQHETYDAARQRLRAALDHELSAIRTAWTASPAGFAFRVPANTGRDLDWLYQRVRHQRTVSAIVALENGDSGDAPMVQKASKAMAERLGVELS